MTGIRRRDALGLVGAAGLAAGCAGLPQADGAGDLIASGPSQVFRHGLASGDPDATSVIIWTRITGAESSLNVAWRVSRDAEFRDIAATGTFVTGPERDWTVKPLVTGLLPGEVYYYEFSALGETSPRGRTRTLPASGPSRLGIALASCSNYAFGFFNAYALIARDETIDFVLHTGDYIYEYGGAGSWGSEVAATIGRPHYPPHEIVSLDNYRTRHAQYKSDGGSRAMHAAHPLLCCWDDHESTNNPWKDGAQNHQPETEGSWAARRDASIQAYYEWMPVRDPASGESPLDFWRSYVFGDLATLVTLETRHTARGRQVEYDEWRPQLQTDDDYERFRAEVIGDPEREMLSEGMLQHLANSLAASREMNQPWRLIGNAIPMARMLVPDLVGAGILPIPEDQSLDAHKRLAWLGAHGLPFYTDTWDGYPAARERFYDLCKSADVQDLIVLTGDSHSFWLNELADGNGNPMGIEIGTAGITSPGDFVESGFDDTIARALDGGFAELLEEVVWTDNMHQGYVRLTLTADRATADYVAVRTVLLPDAVGSIIRTAELQSDGARLALINLV